MSVPLVTPTRAYMCDAANAPLHEGEIKRREPRDTDVAIDIHYCGICHSDVHQAKNEWGIAKYPLVPGHEIVGLVSKVGSKVTNFKVGDRVGVGCMVDSCGDCISCKHDAEQHCVNRSTGTYASDDKISGGHTFGGYSASIVVDHRFVLHIPDAIPLEEAAPLLCAGITTWTPLIEHKVGEGSKVGVVGVGGLGHVCIQLAKALGATVVAFTSKASKREELIGFGASTVVVTGNEEDFKSVANSLDLIVDTVSDEHDLSPYLGALRFRGIYHIVGGSPLPLKVPAFPMLIKSMNLTGSLIGGIKPTQDMLNLSAEKGVRPKIEIGQLKDVNTLYERLLKGDVKYRFVLDIKGAYHK